MQYTRRRPEETLLYQVIDDHYPDFLAQIEAEGRDLPQFVRREFEEYLKCGRLEHGFRGCAVPTVMQKSWLPSAANAVGSVPVAAPAGW
jgi:hypothetical protein